MLGIYLMLQKNQPACRDASHLSRNLMRLRINIPTPRPMHFRPLNMAMHVKKKKNKPVAIIRHRLKTV